jgi:hypothetical protein
MVAAEVSTAVAGFTVAGSMVAGSMVAGSMVADLAGFTGMDFTVADSSPDSAGSTIRTTATTTTDNLLLPRRGIIAPTQRAITHT